MVKAVVLAAAELATCGSIRPRATDPLARAELGPLAASPPWSLALQPWSLAALVRTTAHLCTAGDKKGSILRKYDHLRVGVVEPQACPAIQLLRVGHPSHSLVTPE